MLGKAQKIIVIITVIITIICFSMLIWSFIQLKKDQPWPPSSQPCPDNWTINNGVCSGFCNGEAATANFAGFTDCDKYNWTEGVNGGCNGALWDGISYGYGEHDPCYTV
jgi:hypothetical protein